MKSGYKRNFDRKREKKKTERKTARNSRNEINWKHAVEFLCYSLKLYKESLRKSIEMDKLG